MKKNQVKIGGLYTAKVSDRIVAVRIDSVNASGGWNATNTTTSKRIRIKSAQRLRGVAKGETAKAADGAKPATAKKVATKAKKATKPATKKTKATTKKTKTAKRDGKMSGLDAAAKILADKNEPMRVKDIVDQALAKGLWTTNGKTPHATVYAAIIREIATSIEKGKVSRFRKTDRGLFEFNRKAVK